MAKDMHQAFLLYMGNTRVIDVPDKVVLLRSQLRFGHDTYTLLNGRPCPEQFQLGQGDVLSVHNKLRGGLFFSGGSQESNQTTRKTMSKSLANELNKSVSQSISIDQRMSVGDIDISGEGNTLELQQTGTISAQAYISQIAKTADKMQSSLISQLEAAVAQEKGGKGVEAGASASPFGGSVGGGVGSLVSTNNQTTNTLDEVESYLDMTNAISESVRMDDSITAQMDVGNIRMSGKGNTAKLGQDSRIDKLTKIAQESATKRDVEETVQTSSKVSQKMESKRKSILSLGGIAALLFVGGLVYYLFFSGGAAQVGQMGMQAAQMAQTAQAARASLRRGRRRAVPLAGAKIVGKIVVLLIGIAIIAALYRYLMLWVESNFPDKKKSA